MWICIRELVVWCYVCEWWRVRTCMKTENVIHVPILTWIRTSGFRLCSHFDRTQANHHIKTNPKREHTHAIKREHDNRERENLFPEPATCNLPRYPHRQCWRRLLYICTLHTALRSSEKRQRTHKPTQQPRPEPTQSGRPAGIRSKPNVSTRPTVNAIALQPSYPLGLAFLSFVRP